MKQIKPTIKYCKRGHDLAVHSYYLPDGTFHGCKLCKKITSHNWHIKQYEINPDWQIHKHLKQNWGLTLQQYDDMLEKQGNCCAICKTDDFGKTRGAIDHDHITGKIRGILCNNCNNGLGRFKDDIDNLKQAIIYLKKDW
jgi:hypothetical protein